MTVFEIEHAAPLPTHPAGLDGSGHCEPSGSRGDKKHEAAVAATLAWADEAAARGDYADALGWLATVEAVGDTLTNAYHAKQRTWHLMAGRAPQRSTVWGRVKSGCLPRSRSRENGARPRADFGSRTSRLWHYAFVVLRVLPIAWLFNTVALYVATWLLAGLDYGADWWSLLIAGLVFTLVNTFLKPVLTILSIPFIVVTLGVFYFLINVLMLYVTHWIVPQFTIDRVWWAALAAVIVSLVNGILHVAVGRPRELAAH